MQESKIPFTSAKYQQMKNEVETLRQELAAAKQRLQEAREQGDLSENGAYKYAKFEIGRINRELQTLTDMLSRGAVVETSANPGEFGSYVTLQLPTGKTQRFQLVSQFESDPTNGKLSLDSPIVQALQGKPAGATVDVSTPGGIRTYTIIAWE